MIYAKLKKGLLISVVCILGLVPLSVSAQPYTLVIDGPGTAIDQTLTGLTLSGLGSYIDWDDWFVITVPDPGTLTVDALFLDAQGDIDLWLYDNLTNILDFSLSLTDNEQVSYSVPTGGFDYYIKVHCFGASCANESSPDAYELNDTWQTATRLTSTSVPEPATLLLLGSGLVGLGLFRKKLKK